MPISVTRTESSETITTWVNGRPFDRTEVTKIYVIEPLDQPHQSDADEDELERHMKELGAGYEIRYWRIGIIVAIWVVWVAYIHHVYTGVSLLSWIVWPDPADTSSDDFDSLNITLCSSRDLDQKGESTRPRPRPHRTLHIAQYRATTITKITLHPPATR